MKESNFHFEYSWSDLQPIRALTVVVLGAQIAGAALGLLRPQFPHWFESMWFGGALATFPAFLLGLVVQARWKPGSLSEHKIMVRRMGLVSALLSLFAVAMPLIGFGQHGASYLDDAGPASMKNTGVDQAGRDDAGEA